MAAGSKTLATATTYPYQVLRSRMQDNRQGNLPYRGVGDVIKRIWQHDGLIGFYRGLSANILRVLPGTCITFVVYETVSKYLRVQATDNRDETE
jgi:solute carrier family 25 folate transporter 32